MKYSCHVEPLGSSGVLTADSGKYPSSEYRSVRDEYVYLKEKIYKNEFLQPTKFELVIS
jgi:hypothetical protein